MHSTLNSQVIRHDHSKHKGVVAPADSPAATRAKAKQQQTSLNTTIDSGGIAKMSLGMHRVADSNLVPSPPPLVYHSGNFHGMSSAENSSADWKYDRQANKNNTIFVQKQLIQETTEESTEYEQRPEPELGGLHTAEQASAPPVTPDQAQLRQAGEVEDKSIGAQSLGPSLRSSPPTDSYYLQHMQSTHQQQHIHLHHAQENKKIGRMVLELQTKARRARRCSSRSCWRESR